MRRAHLPLLACPACRAPLRLEATGEAEVVDEGTLSCTGPCGGAWPILGGVPRFVPLDNVASSFGFQWRRHAATQLDSHSGLPISETRFFGETGWPRGLAGETLLEVGSGAGRFTEQALRTGATVVSVDYSRAVEANQASNGAHPNLLLVQADIHALPVPPGAFDRVLCIGVLQHLPDPAAGFRCLPGCLRPGGHLAIDVYRRYGPGGLLMTKYWVRPFLRRVPPERLYGKVDRHVRRMWPLARLLGRVPKVGRAINWNLLVADYRGALPLSEEQLLEWAVLDTFDMLSPRFDHPQTRRAVRRWFREAGLESCEVAYGYTGIYGRGRRPAAG
ncbi:MAG TPA: methyltransferase domain-containing protein [Candidatus Thermoplasmatota archaeon]|nr:methyltransferase domain-containing protein [Candidatus Thermoplasmatota archaeon]